MISLGHRDEVSMVSAVVCTVTHWTRPIVSHDVRLSGGHDITKLLYYIICQP